MQTMETYNHGSPGALMVILSWLLNIVSYIDRGSISFTLSTVCSVLAIVYYMVRLVKENKSTKDVGKNDEG